MPGKKEEAWWDVEGINLDIFGIKRETHPSATLSSALQMTSGASLPCIVGSKNDRSQCGAYTSVQGVIRDVAAGASTTEIFIEARKARSSCEKSGS